MSIEALMQKVQASITKSIQMYVGTEPTAKQRSQIKANVLQILEPYYYHGYIDMVPLVDVNHETELDWLSQRISIMRSNIDNPQYDNNALNHGIRELGARYSILKKDIENPRSIYIFLKNPDTFEKIAWSMRGEYDQ